MKQSIIVEKWEEEIKERVFRKDQVIMTQNYNEPSKKKNKQRRSE
jgi:hypothetical protein